MRLFQYIGAVSSLVHLVSCRLPHIGYLDKGTIVHPPQSTTLDIPTLVNGSLGDFPINHLVLTVMLKSITDVASSNGNSIGANSTSATSTSTATPPAKTSLGPTEKEVYVGTGNILGNLFGGFTGSAISNAHDGPLKAVCEGIASGIGASSGTAAGTAVGWKLAENDKEAAAKENSTSSNSTDPSHGHVFGNGLIPGFTGAGAATIIGTAFSKVICGRLLKDILGNADEVIEKFLDSRLDPLYRILDRRAPEVLAEVLKKMNVPAASAELFADSVTQALKPFEQSGLSQGIQTLQSQVASQMAGVTGTAASGAMTPAMSAALGQMALVPAAVGAPGIMPAISGLGCLASLSHISEQLGGANQRLAEAIQTGQAVSRPDFANARQSLIEAARDSSITFKEAGNTIQDTPSHGISQLVKIGLGLSQLDSDPHRPHKETKTITHHHTVTVTKGFTSVKDYFMTKTREINNSPLTVTELRTITQAHVKTVTAILSPVKPAGKTHTVTAQPKTATKTITQPAAVHTVTAKPKKTETKTITKPGRVHTVTAKPKKTATKTITKPGVVHITPAMYGKSYYFTEPKSTDPTISVHLGHRVYPLNIVGLWIADP